MTSRVASFIRLLVLSLCDEYGHVWTANVAGAHFPGLKLSVLVSSGLRMRIYHSSTSGTRRNGLRRVRQTNTPCLIENHVSAFITSSKYAGGVAFICGPHITQRSYEPFNLPIECMVVIMKRHPHVARTSWSHQTVNLVFTAGNRLYGSVWTIAVSTHISILSLKYMNSSLMSTWHIP